MTNIVERLRAENSVRLACGLDLSDVLLDAANEIERLRREVLSVEPTPIWVHQKRGTAYRELGRATLQAATGPAAEGDTLVIYRGDDGQLWAREAHEFEDGRFALVAALLEEPGHE